MNAVQASIGRPHTISVGGGHLRFSGPIGNRHPRGPDVSSGRSAFAAHDPGAVAATAKVLADMPLSVLEPLIFTTIVYWMAGLQPVFWNYFMFMLTVGTYSPTIELGPRPPIRGV